MGVASPFQSKMPLEYWLGGLTTTELVRLWEFLSRNLDEEPDIFENANAFREMCMAEDLPTGEEVRKHIYSRTMPSFLYACKDRGDPPGFLPPQEGE